LLKPPSPRPHVAQRLNPNTPSHWLNVEKRITK
jgi:hypothetical protein